MNSIGLRILAVLSFLLMPCLCACASTDLPFGQVTNGSIAAAGQTDSYTFSASANDVVDFTVVTTSGGMNPRLRLYSPTGALLNDQANRYYGACNGGSVIELNTVTLAVSGAYTVLIGDCSDTSTGGYDLYMQRPDNPSGPISLPFGQVQSGTIGSAALDNTYTFSASANDVVDFTVVTTNGSMNPRIRLYDPSGNQLADQANRYYGACNGGSVIELNTVTLAVSGAYTVLIGDCSDTSTGTYSIYTQRTNNPTGAASLPLAQVQSGTIGSAALDNTYTFSASANDVVDFTVVTTSGGMNPRLRLYSPTGALLNDQANRYYGACNGGSVIELNTVTLAVSGAYTVLIGDCNDSNTGNYTLTPQCSRANVTGKCTDPLFLPNTKFFHGVEALSWAPPSVATVFASASLTLSGPIAQTLGTNLPQFSTMTWDTTTVPDGNYQLTLSFLDANGHVIASATKNVLINNSVVWHSGTITSNQTWSSTAVNGIDANLIIPSGVTVTIQPGTIVKVVPGVGITVQSGGVLNALGTDSAQIVFTSIYDSSVGGDTMLDGGVDVASSGEWDGVTVQGTGQFNTNSDTKLLYWQAIQTGTLAASETWSGSQVNNVTGNIVVPSGVTLTIQPGSIVKLNANTGITVQAGGSLVANGTVAQPIYFTSIKDDSVGGDTNGDGAATSPAAGDWGTILIDGATASFDHVQMSYGGGPVGSSTNVIGMLQTAGSATVTISNSVLAQSFWDGILTGYPGGGDTVTVTNSVLHGIEGRGINAWPGSTVHVVNTTFDNDGVGVMVHGGTVDVANTIITNTKGTNGWAALEVCCSGNLASVGYSDVWAHLAGVANYGGVSDPTGTNGNISADPVFVNAAQGDYRLNFGSPAIDAADGQVAGYSLTDIMGDPRYSDPEVMQKTGVPDTNGNYPDMGAYEFVQNAVSNIDFTVTSVIGPVTAQAGDQVQVTWTVSNIGSGTAVGPWHDSVYLVRDPDTNPVELFAAQVLVGSGVVMGPGASYTNTATIRVPGSTIGNHRWEVKTNTAGDIFEGQNTNNNTGRSLSFVTIDLPQLLVNGSSLSNSFAAAGQSWWYKLIPGAGNTVGANLQLTGNSGSVQLFVGQGYVPTPQQFDIQQQQWNSPSVSAAIPNTSTQTYYVTAYAQTLPSAPAAFTISAVSQQFSLTSVQPSSIVNGGAVTIEFIGAELTANATYQIVGAKGAAYTASSVYASDSAHVYATFAASGLATGAYAAQVTESGSTLSLNNAITVTAPSAQPVTAGQIAYDIQVPDAVRAGYGGVVTIQYQNTGSDDVAAPLMMLTATGATTQFIAPISAATVSPNFATLYTTMVGQGQLLGINQNGGPVGVLPAGAVGSVSLDFTAGSGSNVQFGLYTVTDPTATINWASASSSMQPSWVSADAWSAIFGNFAAAVGNSWGQYNAALANDATYLGQLGIQEYRVSQLQAFELMKAGLDTISRRYYLGAFGRGASHPFDIWGEGMGSGYLFQYPNGTVRVFVADPNNAGQFIGGIGDYATLFYNSSDQSVLLTEKNGIAYHFFHDSNTGHVLFDYIQDLNGNRITANYANGMVASATSSTGDTLTFTYDGNGRITQATDPVGRTTAYSYDTADQHLLSITNDSGTIGMTYITGQGAAEEHALQSVTWQDGTHTYYGYDAQGRLINVQKDGGAQQITLAYASTGAITLADALGNAWQISPDANGSVAQLADPLGNLTQMLYDPEEKLIRTIGPDGSATSLTYDSNGNPTGERDPLGNQLSTSFAANGDLLGLTDALGDSTQYGYDSHYNATSITYPDTRQVQATYDSRGNIISWTNRRGQTITYTWNGNNLLTQKTRSNGATVNYTYDGHRNLQSVTDSSGTTNLTYDSADRLTQVTYPTGRFVKYTYDSGGRRSSLSDQTGYTVDYAYDGVGRLSQLTSAIGSLIASYTYDGDGRLSQKNLGNGAYSTYVYDAAGHVLHLINYSAQGVVNSRFDYTYDTNGRKTAMTTLDGLWQYSYDADGQVTSVTLPTTSAVQYTYDAAGNRTTTVSGAASTNYNVNNLNQYTSVGGHAYNYDADGNLISKSTSSGTWTYTYDDEGRLLTASGPSGSWTYQYDSFGNRISSVNGSTTTQYLVDPTGIGSVEADFDGTGTLVSHFANGLGLESSAPASANADFYQFDDSGNTATVTGTGGTVADAYSFLPFGEKVKNSVTVSNPYTYVGQFGVADDGNGLYYMRARYYDPVLGRFFGEDPMDVFGGDLNLYRYAQNGSPNILDPNGQCPWCVVAVIGGGVGAYSGWLKGASHGDSGWQLAGDVFGGATAGAAGTLVGLAIKNPQAGSVAGAIVNDLLNDAWQALTSGGNCGDCWNIGNYTLDALIGGNLGGVMVPFQASRFQPWNSAWRAGTWGKSGWSLYEDTAGSSLWGTILSYCFTSPSVCENPFNFSGGSAQTQNIPIARSADPNGKITVGYGNQGYIPPGAMITYTIYFENQSSATAPAAQVVVTDALDSNLDASTVQLSQIGFNNVTLNVPGALQSYSTQASVSTSPYPVTVSAALNPGTATLTWTMQSIDPTTGAAPADPLAGFLPPDNSSKQGEGFVIFTVKAKSGVANGTAINNTASIVFDRNAAMSTNTVTNTIDSVYPSSTVSALPATQTAASFTVSWSGSDPSGSGIASYDVFSATDGGAYSLWLPATTNTSAAFTGGYGHSYSFYTMATDNVGNRQQTPGPAQTTFLDEVPSITSAGSTTFMVSTTGTFTVTAIGFPTVALSEVGALPSGVNFNDNGNGSATLSGTPATGTIGTYPITITATNSVGTNATQNFSLTVTQPALSISSLGPDSTAPGGAAFTLTVNGTSFASGAVVEWNGTSLTTSFVSATQLTASVPAALIASAGIATITVANPGAVTSGGVGFPIQSGPAATAVSPGAGNGASQTFTFTFSDPSGYQNLGVLDVLINNYLDGIQACYIALVPSGANAGTVYLVDDGGDAGGPFAGNLVLPGTGSVSNSQCTVNGTGSSVVGSGTTITLTLNIGFSASFTGNRIFYTAARDTGTGNSGWQALSTWQVPGATATPTQATGVTPAIGSGASQSFVFTFADSAGWQDLGVVDVLFNNFLDGIQGCYIAYSVPAATLYLVDDGGDAGGPFAGYLGLPGTGSMSNSQCTVSAVGSSASGSGNTLTLTLNINFSSSFAGNRIFYTAAGNAAGTENSGWHALGAWTVP
jgi:RHS repeat-associated protein